MASHKVSNHYYGALMQYLKMASRREGQIPILIDQFSNIKLKDVPVLHYFRADIEKKLASSSQEDRLMFQSYLNK